MTTQEDYVTAMKKLEAATGAKHRLARELDRLKEAHEQERCAAVAHRAEAEGQRQRADRLAKELAEMEALLLRERERGRSGADYYLLQALAIEKDGREQERRAADTYRRRAGLLEDALSTIIGYAERGNAPTRTLRRQATLIVVIDEAKQALERARG
jgi:hypothetical protein